MSLEVLLETEFGELLDDERSLKVLRQGFESGSTILSDLSVDECFDRLDGLPANPSRLSWEEIPHLGISQPDGIGADGKEPRLALACKLELLASIGKFFGIHDQRGVLFEDLRLDGSLEMTFADFASLGPEFFRTPGHKYFLDLQDKWLVNFMMEEDLFFTNRLKEMHTSIAEV